MRGDGRAPRHRSRLRSQRHRRGGCGRRPGTGSVRRRTGSDGTGLRHTCRRERNRQGDHGEPRCLRRDTRGHDGSPDAQGRRHPPVLRASRSWRITYTGRGGHASRPWSALNAADATVLAQTAVGLLRQQLRDGIRVHHMVREAGAAVNVIADHAVVDCMIRCDTIAEVDEVWERVRPCFDAGAVATGTGVEYVPLPSVYREFRHDPDLAPLFQKNAEAVGRTFPDYPDKMFGSTDMGNVSLRIPGIHPMLSFDLPPEAGNHTAAFAAAAGGPEGDRFVRDAGLAMALTFADVARSEPVRTRLLTRSTETDAVSGN
nr:peptidase dimerization domain-containing protein [Streptomyces aurantiacus]